MCPGSDLDDDTPCTQNNTSTQTKSTICDFLLFSSKSSCTRRMVHRCGIQSRRIWFAGTSSHQCLPLLSARCLSSDLSYICVSGHRSTRSKITFILFYFKVARTKWGSKHEQLFVAKKIFLSLPRAHTKSFRGS